MHQPGARVIHLERKQEPALGGQHCDVSPGGVAVSQLGEGECRLSGCEWARRRGRTAEDHEVMALPKGSFEVRIANLLHRGSST
jgi:hypothetical protein